MKKQRVPIPDEVATDILFFSDRTCCVCNVPGKPIQLHHIDENPANNLYSNIAVLCLDCHNDTMIKGGFGRKLDAHQITKFRNDWLERVKKRKEAADNIASVKAVVGETHSGKTVFYKSTNDLDLLVKYLNKIILIRRIQWELAKTTWNENTTADLLKQGITMISFYEEVLNELATFYPENRFGGSPSRYFSEIISARFTWYHEISHPVQTAPGTMVIVTVRSRVMKSLQVMVSEMVQKLIYNHFLEKKVIPSWEAEWFKD